MADVTLNKITSLLYDMKGPMQSLYATRNYLLAYWSGQGQDGAPGRITPLQDPTRFNGAKVRVPLDTVAMQGGGWVAEGGTVNVPIAPVITQAEITLKKFIQPFGISLEAMEDSSGSNSAVAALALSLEKARKAMAENVNTAMNGAGDGLLGTVSSHSNLVSTMVTTAGSTMTDWDKFYVGQIVDVLTRADGTDAGQGKRRKISAIDISAGTITFDTASQASDGGSGNITASSSSGLYVPGSYGNVLAGGFEAAGQGTSFQNVTLANYPQFKAVDGRAAVTTTLPFSDAMVDLGIILAERAGDADFDAAHGDPNAINVYKNAKQNQTRFNVATGTVAGRFSGVQIDAGQAVITLVAERKCRPGSIKFYSRDAATLYGSTPGPDYDDQTGNMFKQFNRTTNYEVWLKDRLELGWHNPSKLVYFNNLSVQSTAG